MSRDQLFAASTLLALAISGSVVLAALHVITGSDALHVIGPIVGGVLVYVNPSKGPPS